MFLAWSTESGPLFLELYVFLVFVFEVHSENIKNSWLYIMFNSWNRWRTILQLQSLMVIKVFIRLWFRFCMRACLDWRFRYCSMLISYQVSIIHAMSEVRVGFGFCFFFPCIFLVESCRTATFSFSRPLCRTLYIFVLYFRELLYCFLKYCFVAYLVVTCYIFSYIKKDDAF